MGKLLLNKNATIYSYTHLSPEWDVSKSFKRKVNLKNLTFLKKSIEWFITKQQVLWSIYLSPIKLLKCASSIIAPILSEIKYLSNTRKIPLKT